jgi:hypothetical protein
VYIWELRWVDVAPSTHVLDVARVESRIAETVRAHASGRERERIVMELGRLFVSELGDWTAGWSWAVSSGGPVRHFCCTSHSILPDGENDPARTIARARNALVDWHQFLGELEVAFDQLDRSGSPAEIVERGAPVVFDIVVTRTGSEDAWYATYQRAMGWLAETVVYDVERARELVDLVVEGSFRSWTEPTPAVRDETFLELAVSVETLESAHVQVDGLAAWLAIRPDAFVGPPSSSPFATDDELQDRAPIAAGQDGHERFIAERDGPRDAERAARMTSALVLCRDAARHDLPLAFDLLAEWQAVVLDASSPIEFRKATAYAKRGRERYPVDATTHARFEHLLGDAGDRAPIAVRAARAYLDICFFHPFSDGNARAARLAVDHVLAREGLALRDAKGIFTLSRAAGDARSAWSLAKAIDRVAAPRWPGHAARTPPPRQRVDA